MLRVWIALLFCLMQIATAEAKSPLIAAASSLRFVMPELEQAFIDGGGTNLRVSFGSSGNLSRQIMQGAPHELFLSADTSYVTALVEKGLTKDKGALYAYGRLALITAKNSGVEVKPDFASIRAMLASGRLKRFAIANPEHAPYGRAAREVLEKTGLWEKIQPFLILGENISQTAQFAISSAAQGGLVSYSLALAPVVAAKTKQVQIPNSWYKPLKHHMVLLKGAAKETVAFYNFLRSPQAQTILARNGFSSIR